MNQSLARRVQILGARRPPVQPAGPVVDLDTLTDDELLRLIGVRDAALAGGDAAAEAVLVADPDLVDVIARATRTDSPERG